MKLIISVVVFLIVPAELAFTFFTRGEYMPSIATPHPQQWNIQYLPLVLSSVLAAIVALTAWRRWPVKSLAVAAVWNACWFGIALYAVVTLWGEKI